MAQRLAPFLAVAVASLLLAAPAPAAPDELSSRLAMVSGAGLRSAPEPEQARAVSLLPHGPGSLLRDPAGNLIVNVRVSGAARERVTGLRDAGASIVAVAPAYHLISVSAGEEALRSIARAPGVESVTEELTPMSGRVASPAARRTLNTCAPGVVSEGDQQLGADVARARYRVDGAGIKVGVMSDSFNTGTPATKAANDIATADLPGPGNPCGRTTPVQVLDDSATQAPPKGPTADEGRAMTQIVHDLAPGADLAFATAFTGQVAFAANIKALANAGADVIADDIIYFAEPYYQDGIVANAVNDVTTNQGVAYFSMAFNNNRIIAGNDSNSWEAPAYRNAGSCPAPVGGTDCMDFDPGPGVDSTFDLTWSGSSLFRIGLQWAEPQNGVATNLDLYVIDAATNTVVASSTQNNVTSGLPSEFVAFTPNSTTAGNYRLVIRRVAGFAPRLKSDQQRQRRRLDRCAGVPGLLGRRRRRADDLRPQRHRRSADGRRGALLRQHDDRALLGPRPGDAPVRAGRRRHPGAAARSRRGPRQARRRRDRRRHQLVLRVGEPVLRHIGRGAACRGDRSAPAGCGALAERGRGEGEAEKHRDPGRQLRAARGRRRPDRRPGGPDRRRQDAAPARIREEAEEADEEEAGPVRVRHRAGCEPRMHPRREAAEAVWHPLDVQGQTRPPPDPRPGD